MTLYIFQFGFLQPIAILVNSQLPIAIFTLILLFIMLLNNKFKIKSYVIIALLLTSVYFLSSSLIFKNSSSVILPLYIEFLMKSFSAFMIGSLDIEENYFYKVFLKVAFINFIVLLPLPLIGVVNTIGYMRYGYAMAPSVLVFSYEIYKNKKIKIVWLLLTMASFLLTLIYGSRGPLVGFLLYFLIIFIFSSKINKYKKSLLVIGSGVVMFLITKYQLLLKFLDYLYFNLNIKTYALAKFRMMITSGLLESSSGRDTIYLTLWDYIKNNLVFGHGIGYSNVVLGYTSHNIILQILLESGIFGLIMWLVVWILSYTKLKKIYNKRSHEFFNIIIVVGSLAIGRLLISSDMWIRPEYWLVVSILTNYKNIEKTQI